MAQYSIKELEELSGIKAHTIRIWEKRYGLVSPHRTATNIRRYSDDDLKKIMSIALLNTQGLRISKIAKLTGTELANRVNEIGDKTEAPEIHIDRLVVSMIDLDEAAFSSTLDKLIQRFGFETTILDTVYPFLKRIGVLWLSGNITPIQEHFISNLIRQKILVAIDRLPLARKKTSKVLLFLAEGELHELGLLFSYFLVKKAGLRAYYMGQSVPEQDVQWFCKTEAPVAVVTSITSFPSPAFVEPYLAKLCRNNPQVKILAAGPYLNKMALKMPPNLVLVQDAHHLKSLLRQFTSEGPKD